MEFGTGAVKMTPAHDPNDYEVALRHNLEIICVLTEDGHMNENAGRFQGMSAMECREALVKELQDHVKRVTAPYKYPRVVEFVEELPKTISGKIRRVEIRDKDNQ